MRTPSAVAAHLLLAVLAAADEAWEPADGGAPSDGSGEGGAQIADVQIADDGKSAIVGDHRVQALSPFLLRVEPKGPNGFEDRTTFMVVDRSFEGLKLKKDKKGQLKTDHYTVQISDGATRVWDAEGQDVYDSEANPAWNKLHWPSPYSCAGYAIMDYPRFFMPEWKVAPVSPEDGGENNGYDFSNDVEGDTYIFLMGKGIEGWNAARTEFLKLTGPVPLIPDWSFGTWFTWWNFYTEDVAKSEVQRWIDDKVPLDVWGLDMNWRLIDNDADLQYDQPNGSAFQDYGQWFTWLAEKGIHTYFNDHPGQRAPQTTPDEVNFRWNGLTSWMEKGLTFWWFDHNWKFSIPPPNAEPPVVTGVTANSEWEGLTTSCWGSHVYYTIAEAYNKNNRPDDKFHGGRPIILAMQAPHNEISGYNVDENPLKEGAIAPPLDPLLMAEHPAHHRYPVWWNGDFATMNNNLESMVDAGVHDLKPYVHPDCGGDGWFVTATDLLRQTQMCAFGTILRYHGGPHQPWIYGEWWEGIIRRYINMRYSFMPMIIAGGQRATQTGFPFVARCDLYWPEHGESSSSNHQYMFLDDILVAPIFDSSDNYTERDVWFPPGAWQDVWNGEVKYGPADQRVGQQMERMPMWVRMDGGMLIWTDKPGQTVAGGDWSTLVVEVWPCPRAQNTTRTVYERSTEENPPSQNVTLSTDGSGTATIEMTKSDDNRAWVVRVNLLVGQTVGSASVDGKSVPAQVYKPRKEDDGTYEAGPYTFWPFGGEGSRPASKAGHVVEVKLPASTSARRVEVVIETPEPAEKPKTKAAPAEKPKAKAAAAEPAEKPKTKAAPAEKPKTKAAPAEPAEEPKAKAAPAEPAEEPKAKVAPAEPAKEPKAKAPPADPAAGRAPSRKQSSSKKPQPAAAAIGASQLPSQVAQSLSQGAGTACAIGGCLLAVLALAGLVARAARWRAPYAPVQAPPQSPEAAAPLVEQSRAEDA